MSTYDEFLDSYEHIHASDRIQDSIIKLRDLLNANKEVDESTVNEMTSDVTEFLKNDQRVERFEVNNGILEIYTTDVIFNAVELYGELYSSVYNDIPDEYKTLNFGKFCILIKPGCYPCAFPYDVSNYNVPSVYRHRATIHTKLSIFERGFDIRRSNDGTMDVLTTYHWYANDVGKHIGIRRLPSDSRVHATHKVIYPHPHVHPESTICYGNSESMITDALKTGQVGFVVSLTLDVLFSYSNDSPYFRLWTCDVCSMCDHDGTYRCLICECARCGYLTQSSRCVSCPNKRGYNHKRLLSVAKSMIEITAKNKAIPKDDRVEKLKGIIDAYFEEYPIIYEKRIENGQGRFIDRRAHVSGLLDGELIDLLGADYDGTW